MTSANRFLSNRLQKEPDQHLSQRLKRNGFGVVQMGFLMKLLLRNGMVAL
jgi:hypothetical protein